MPNITHIWIPVTDIATAKEFYVDKLKLKLEQEQTIDHKVIVQLRSSGGDVVMLFQDNDHANKRCGEKQIAIGWFVGNLEQIREAFEKNGVIFEGEIMTTMGMKLIHMRDPDGHLLQLAEKISS